MSSPAALSWRRFPGLALVALAAVLALLGAAGCSSTATPSSGSGTPSTSAAVALSDGYVKATAKDGDMAMSAIFGTLTNTTGSDVSLVKASSDAAGTVELHEMVMDGGAMKMRPKDGGILVPANGTAVLDPGGLHIMLIGLARDIKAGDTVTADLEFSNGDKVTATVVGRDMANANESYDPTNDNG
ncbi:copper chaperone PCu(A)C [Microlunatus aurantiacus]|uniref:copper chaperone PCu(A)C n=1 Tax=Microlunatus aurantiacus TaxID=446786 RepID=UPI0031DD2A11